MIMMMMLKIMMVMMRIMLIYDVEDNGGDDGDDGDDEDGLGFWSCGRRHLLPATVIFWPSNMLQVYLIYNTKVIYRVVFFIFTGAPLKL